MATLKDRLKEVVGGYKKAAEPMPELTKKMKKVMEAAKKESKTPTK